MREKKLIVALLLSAIFLAGCGKDDIDRILEPFSGNGKPETAVEAEGDKDIPTVIYNTDEYLGDQADGEKTAALVQSLEDAFSVPPLNAYGVPENFWSFMGTAFGAKCLEELDAAAKAQSFTDQTWYEATHNTYHVLKDRYEDSLGTAGKGTAPGNTEKEAASPDETVLCFAGDVCLDDGYSNMAALRSRENGIYGSISEDLMAELSGCDILMLNNEFPYSGRGTPTPGKQYTFRARPENAEILTQMGVDIVSLANNHAYDHGPDALLDTFDTLAGAGISYAGAGRNLEEAMRPVYFTINGRKLAFAAATQIERNAVPDTPEATDSAPGVLRTLDPEKFLEVIGEARQNSDLVIVFVHWGSENAETVEQSQRELAQKYAEAGADLILGAHSHCLQGFEYVGNVPVLYSLGNFWFNSKSGDTCLLKVRIGRDGAVACQMLPCLLNGSKTALAQGGEKQRVLRYMESISYKAVLDSDGYLSPAPES